MAQTPQQQQQLYKIYESIFAGLRERANAGQFITLRRQLARCSTATAARSALADLFVRIPDEAFDVVVAATSDKAFNGNEFFRAVTSPFPRRRMFAIQVAFDRLKDAATGMLPAATLHARCDMSRNVPRDRRDEARAEFLSLIDVDGSDLSLDDFEAFYRGFPLSADDTGFELHVTRTWNLDVPDHLLTTAQSTAATKGGFSPNSTASSSASSAGRSHPLYQTSNAVCGAGLDKAFPPVTKFNRTGEFTKKEPLPQPSSGLNTAKTVGRFM